jgi:hypothetical protein
MGKIFVIPSGVSEANEVEGPLLLRCYGRSVDKRSLDFASLRSG